MITHQATRQAALKSTGHASRKSCCRKAPRKAPYLLVASHVCVRPADGCCWGSSSGLVAELKQGCGPCHWDQATGLGVHGGGRGKEPASACRCAHTQTTQQRCWAVCVGSSIPGPEACVTLAPQSACATCCMPCKGPQLAQITPQSSAIILLMLCCVCANGGVLQTTPVAPRRAAQQQASPPRHKGLVRNPPGVLAPCRGLGATAMRC